MNISPRLALITQNVCESTRLTSRFATAAYRLNKEDARPHADTHKKTVKVTNFGKFVLLFGRNFKSWKDVPDVMEAKQYQKLRWRSWVLLNISLIVGYYAYFLYSTSQDKKAYEEKLASMKIKRT